MPFKTRREKIAAGARRFVFSEGKVSLADVSKLSKVSATAKKEIGEISPRIEKVEDYGYVAADVLRTVFIALSLIAIQIILHFKF